MKPAKPNIPGFLSGFSGIALLMLALLLPDRLTAQENPYTVKAAFLRNFTHYISWPDHTFPNNGAAWHIGILGQDPFGATLEATFQNRTEQSHPFEIFRAEQLEDLPPCQIIFIAYQDGAKRRAALIKLRNKPVLTVGDAEEFLLDGGIIQFQVTDRVRMGVNLDQARASSLTIQTKMLEVSTDILENGELRRMR
ncbi:YfiR family protein [Methylomonas albis]|uniref:YfiR family protein n=1 Tax=Methylomonas albis TaxID=1854563 RepID=A0ABR9D458_9GAMM|nr:YfiR family protein [Methylomonas albis]MBD9357905.1 YfiR family protein [Methylomonas albis]